MSEITDNDLEAEEKLLIKQLAEVKAEVENVRNKQIYSAFKNLYNFLESKNLPISQFFEIGEKFYAKEFGKKPKTPLSSLEFRDDGRRRILPPKYQDPLDSDVVWTGRGKKPEWFIQRLEEGYTEEQLLVSNYPKPKRTRRSKVKESNSSSDINTAEA